MPFARSSQALAEAAKATSEEKTAIELQDRERRTRLTLETQCNMEIMALKKVMIYYHIWSYSHSTQILALH